MGDNKITVEKAAESLRGLIAEGYQWAEVPAGWDLVFIAHPDGSVEMDFAHPVSRSFWSDENDYLQLPSKIEGGDIDVYTLKKAQIPFMTSFSTAEVVETKMDRHLKPV
ncbi:TPA: hypothetical protein ACSCYS_003360 [Aeromonas veronii]